jgi:hypothetical protein
MRTRGEEGEELRLLEGLHVREVEVAPRAPELPHHCVVRAHDQLRRVLGTKGEVETAGAELDVEHPVGARADITKAE